jgi:hypothetical protein
MSYASLSPRHRHLVSAAITLALVLTTAGTANACIATCVNRVGSVFKKGGFWWELVSCTQTETWDGPVYVTCAYRVYPVVGG